MWRALQRSVARISAVQCRASSSSSFDGENSFSSGSGDSGGQSVHPLLYSVPIMSPRTVGRDLEVMALWQNLLSGRRCQVVVGVDGVGKSTLAAEFADCARRSQRFSCIQWFNAQSNIQDQLKQFFVSMKGRNEKDVLLILDDAPDPAALIAGLPEHVNLHYLLTSSATNVDTGNKAVVTNVEPLTEKSAETLGSEVDMTDALRDVFYTLGYVPLLLEIARHLVEEGVLSDDALLKVLQEKRVRENNALSISQALQVLLDLAVAALEKSYPSARGDLAALACLHINDISDVVVASVVGDDNAGQFAVSAAQLGILSLKWEESAFAIHPSVAAVLRASGGEMRDHVNKAAGALLGLWPRRWRNMGNHLAFNLVWHTRSLFQVCLDSGIALPDALLQSLDRSATFLAHVEARELAVAAQMWGGVVNHYAEHDAVASPEAARVAREYGRLLHYLRDEKAEAALKTAHQWNCTTYGDAAAETALVMACLAPYLPANDDTLESIATSVRALEDRLASVDLVLSPEETRMALESVFVLLMCRGQILQELKRPVPDALWKSLEGVDARLKRGAVR